MTDITELAEKHGAEIWTTCIHVTEAQLKAIIKEASAPLVERLIQLEQIIDNSDCVTQLQDTKRHTNKVLAEFNKEFGDD